MEKKCIIFIAVCAILLGSVSGYGEDGQHETDLFENKRAEIKQDGSQIRREKREFDFCSRCVCDSMGIGCVSGGSNGAGFK